MRAAEASGAAIVASANPGCIAHLSGDPALSCAGIVVRHPVDIVAEALGLVHRMSRVGDLAGHLDEIVAELDELAFDRLQDAVASGATRRPASDKTLTQARRAVEKAAGLLHGLEAGDSQRHDVAVEQVDHRSQVAVAVLGEGEADAWQVDVIAVAAFDVERLDTLDAAR